MKQEKQDVCPNCQEGKISRNHPPLDAGILDAGAWSAICPICKASLDVPLDEGSSIILVCLPGGKADEESADFFDIQQKFMAAVAREGKKFCQIVES